MGLFGRAVVESQIIPAGGFEPFVAENLLDMPNRAAIK